MRARRASEGPRGAGDLLARTQPGLPLKKGRRQTMTHDCKRHGTTALFAALNLASGRVIGTCMNKHRHQEWLRRGLTVKRVRRGAFGSVPELVAAIED